MDVDNAKDVSMTVDARGLACPLPLLKAKQGLAQIGEGECLELWATDKGSWEDIASFAQLSAHTLVEREVKEGEYYYLLRKNS